MKEITIIAASFIIGLSIYYASLNINPEITIERTNIVELVEKYEAEIKELEEDRDYYQENSDYYQESDAECWVELNQLRG